MEREANYAAVGAFVLLVIAMAGAFVYWYAEHQDKRHYTRYEIYFQGSVSGLNEGSSVRFLGVNVGRVSRVAVDLQERNRVQVLADIDTTAPIDGRTLASLSLQGVTGLLFIDLEQDHSANAPTQLSMGQRYPVIRSKSSDFDKLLSALPVLAGHADDLVSRLNLALNDENIKAFSDTMRNMQSASQRLVGTLKGIDQMATQMREAADEVDRMSSSIRGISDQAAPQVGQILNRIQQLTENLAMTSKKLDDFVAQNEKGVARFTDRGLPEFERLLREGRQAAKDIRDLSRSLKQNPSQLIYEPSYRGVEVPR